MQNDQRNWISNLGLLAASWFWAASGLAFQLLAFIFPHTYA